MLNNKRIAILIPAYNEEALIGKVLAGIPKFVDTVIVVDDGSTDRTSIIANDYKALVLSHNMNKGLGIAIQTGISKALELGIDILVSMDADNQFDSADIPRLVEPILERKADLAIGSRFKDKNFMPKISRIKYFGNKIMSLIVTHILNNKFYDVSCGLRAYSQDAMLRFNLHGKFTYTHESLLVLSFQGVAISEVSVTTRGSRELGKPKISLNLASYGFKTIRIIMQTYRDYEPFLFFGCIGCFLLCIAIISGSFIFAYYFITGLFTPYKWVGFISGGSFLLFIVFIILGFVLESLSVMRRNQEKIIYLLKKMDLKEAYGGLRRE